MKSVLLRPHQLSALEKLKNGSILCGGTGSGKSRTAIAYFFLKEGRGSLDGVGSEEFHPLRNLKNLYIITTAKKRDDKDWERELALFSLSRDPGSSISPIEIVVDSWNNIQKYQDVTNAFFIFDEQRLVGRGVWVKAFLKIAQLNRWIMLSATPGDSWSDYIPVFIANGFYRNRTEFAARHIVMSRFTKFPKIERYVDTGILEKYRRDILVEMPFERHTARHVKDVITEFNREKWDVIVKKRWNPFEDAPIKDVAELFRCMRKVVNEDVSRIGAIMDLLERHPRLIIFYNFDYELEILRVLARSLEYPVAELNGHKHEELPDGDRWMFLVQYSAGAEGWNCTSTDAMVFYSLTYSYKVFEQAQGRIDRMNTKFTDLYYYVLMSNSSIDRRIRGCLRAKKSFHESRNDDLWPKTHL